MPYQAENEENFGDLVFVLKEREKSTFVLISYNTESIKLQTLKRLKQELPEYGFFDLDVTPLTVGSLYRTLKENVPGEILESKPVSYLVNVLGLENSYLVSENGQIKEGPLVFMMNLKREQLFRNFPFVTIIWADESFLDILNKQAKDLWSWVTYIYRFRSDEEQVFDKPLPYDSPIQIRGITQDRTERIKELLDIYNRLNLDNSDKQRLLKDKVNILMLLGSEFLRIPDGTHALEYFERALATISHISDNQFLLEEVYFNLGKANNALRRFDEALKYYSQSVEMQKHTNQLQYLGNTYHQIGNCFSNQKKWDEALKNYQLALEWKQKIGDEFSLGNTYHQLGIMYEEERKWNEALQNYQLSIEWNNNRGNHSQLGNTYHQVGMLFAKQRKWNEALQNYKFALEWNEKTGNTFDIGATYHQIGIIYTAQQNWDDALKNYQLALEWKQKSCNIFDLGSTYQNIGILFATQEKWDEALSNFHLSIEYNSKTGNDFKLFGTYHMIGMVYEEQSDFISAKSYYQKALENAEQFDNVEILPTIKESIERIESKIATTQ